MLLVFDYSEIVINKFKIKLRDEGFGLAYSKFITQL